MPRIGSRVALILSRHGRELFLSRSGVAEIRAGIVRIGRGQFGRDRIPARLLALSGESQACGSSVVA